MVRNQHCSHSSNSISYNGILFFLDYSFDNFSKNSAYNAVKKYNGKAKSVHLAKLNNYWFFHKEIF